MRNYLNNITINNKKETLEQFFKYCFENIQFIYFTLIYLMLQMLKNLKKIFVL